MNYDKLIEHLSNGDMLDSDTVLELCEKVKEKLLFQGNIVPVSAPVTVVSNIHGQFSDLLELFCVCGNVPDVNYLFIGDMVDYGYWGVETICLLFCLRLRYPQRVTLLRGEHESRTMTRLYGFYLECMRKYGSNSIWNAVMDVFDSLPIAALVEERVLCVHGGISAEAPTLDKIRVLNRLQEPGSSGPLNNMLWSDPSEYESAQGPEKAPNRGTGVTYKEDATRTFCEKNGLERIVRGHKICLQGYLSSWDGLVTTIWSAPNFLGTCGNAGAALEISDAFTSSSGDSGTFLTGGKVPGFRICTYLAAPESLQRKAVPDPSLEVPRGIPEYFQ